MPELPEVETTRRGIQPYLAGQQITQVVVRQPRLRWPVPDYLPQVLTGATVHAVQRRAKYLLLRTTNGTVIIHLGMSGHLRILPEPISTAGKHDHVDMAVSGGYCLRYTDPRRFGALLWTADDPLGHERLQSLGPEPLSDDFTGQRLYRLTRGRQQPVKLLIMNSAVVVGVGNIYANEALFKAGIRPDKPCGTVSAARYDTLAGAIKTTLTDATAQGGTTLRDFMGSDGKAGYFKQSLTVYDRGYQPCVACTTPIQVMRLANRSTYFCPNCQR